MPGLVYLLATTKAENIEIAHMVWLVMSPPFFFPWHMAQSRATIV
jgi:hypothetical protein